MIMALDGILLYGIAEELRKSLTGGRVEKVHQPEKDELHLLIRSQGENHKLLLSASANHARAHLTHIQKQNPITPPMFCMVLRKHLTGSRLISVKQPGMERILEFSFEGFNELGDVTVKTLTIEIMGRHSNIIFVDKEGKILDSVKHISEAISSVRQVLPGGVYAYPPSQGKLDPLTQDVESLLGVFSDWDKSVNLDRRIAESFTGISKQSAAEIMFRAYGGNAMQTWDEASRGMLAKTFIDFFDEVRSFAFRPTLLIDDTQRPKDISPFPYHQYAHMQLNTYNTFVEALDTYYLERDKGDRISQRTAHMNKVIKINLDRCEKKLAIQEQDILDAQNAEKYRLYGELLTANIYSLPSGVSEVSVHNYYDPDGSNLVIPMDSTKNPQKNAQHYFKLYGKSKTTLEKQKKMRTMNLQEIQYLESLTEHLSKASNELEILEIRQELMREGYIKRAPVKGKGKLKKSPTSKPHQYLSSDGFDIYVGKNNFQNDELTLKFASGNDLWLHTKVIPGSHVIVKSQGQEVPATTLKEAALLAAYYSKGRMSQNVPVDYCPRKNVKKPGGAKPGMVIYDHYNTFYVTPSEEEIAALKKKQ